MLSFWNQLVPEFPHPEKPLTLNSGVPLPAADDDRAAAAMFYYGYLAAKAGLHVINVDKIDGNVGKVMRQCAATPDITVPQAFREALRPRHSSG